MNLISIKDIAYLFFLSSLICACGIDDSDTEPITENCDLVGEWFLYGGFIDSSGTLIIMDNFGFNIDSVLISDPILVNHIEAINDNRVSNPEKLLGSDMSSLTLIFEEDGDWFINGTGVQTFSVEENCTEFHQKSFSGELLQKNKMKFYDEHIISIPSLTSTLFNLFVRV